MPKRCGWVKMSNPLYVAYHDEEWGRPLHDDQALFELLCMETYQAGLSWETVLNKRQAFRESFHGYHLQRVAEMTDEELEALIRQSSYHPKSCQDLRDTGQCSSHSTSPGRIWIV